jgi:hypothetical protein
MIIPIFGLFIVAHVTANLFPTPFKANFESTNRALLHPARFSSQILARGVRSLRDRRTG